MPPESEISYRLPVGYQSTRQRIMSPTETVVEPGNAFTRLHPWTAGLRLASGVRERFTDPSERKIARFVRVYAFPAGVKVTVRTQFCPSEDLETEIPIGAKAVMETILVSFFVTPPYDALTRIVSVPTVVAEKDVWFPVVKDRVPRFCARAHVKATPPRTFPL